MKTLMFALGVALTMASSVQYAAAAGREDQTQSARVVVRHPSRAIDAYAAWPAPQPAPAPYGYSPSYYSGGYSAPAGR